MLTVSIRQIKSKPLAKKQFDYALKNKETRRMEGENILKLEGKESRDEEHDYPG